MGRTRRKTRVLPAQHVSNMARGNRAISLITAKKMPAVFKVSVEHFV